MGATAHVPCQKQETIVKNGQDHTGTDEDLLPAVTVSQVPSFHTHLQTKPLQVQIDKEQSDWTDLPNNELRKTASA